VLELLRSRGHRSDRRHGPLGYTRQLSRPLDLFEVLDALKLESPDVSRLGRYLARLPGFAARAEGVGIADLAGFARMIDGYSFHEKLHLLDAAQLRHPPPPRRGRR
jgi:hypothetical protein